jgi:isocitrate lyase
MGPRKTWVGSQSKNSNQKIGAVAECMYSFVLQLISLAGLHSTAVTTAELSKQFKEDGMLAYVNLIQRREKELGVDVLMHQKWSGAAYVDGILGAIQSGSSSSRSMGEGNTESGKWLPRGQQFKFSMVS